MRFALEVRHGVEKTESFAERLAEVVERAGGVLADDDQDADIVLAVGGDGTMLAGVRRALAMNAPVLGFNLGTVGFLTDAEPDLVDMIIPRLVDGNFEVVERMTVMATVDGVASMGVNDVVVEKIDSQRLVVLAVSIDGNEFVTYRADGLIVATPTGSTAYSFSAGGPLVSPEIESLILTPVAAHSLFDRSMVIPANSQIDITVVRDRTVHVTVDKNDLGLLDVGEVVRVSRGTVPARFVSLGQRSFADLVMTKFQLG